MNDLSLLNIISGRRSIRRYSDQPIPDAIVERVLTAATWAPSAHNRQPWRFAVIKSPEIKEHLATQMGNRLRSDLEKDGVTRELIEADASRSYERIVGAPVLIALCLSMQDMDVYADVKRAHNEFVMAVQSTAMAGQNLLLAAHDTGLGTCWMCAPLFCPDVVRDALALPEDWQPQGLITLGYPAQTREKTRHPLAQQTIWR